ncbi:hypothetical protein JKP88DRAFT_232458 [Tribonema minus]|uniref:Uncharacterized protein n=1 Tax=Tribonema minus TaxID=303371 RepID=A0A835ZGR0_9STRA|nr:hypothetical protein JKP88DRAFT_232458 [Tribonema minus]
MTAPVLHATLPCAFAFTWRHRIVHRAAIESTLNGTCQIACRPPSRHATRQRSQAALQHMLRQQIGQQQRRQRQRQQRSLARRPSFWSAHQATPICLFGGRLRTCLPCRARPTQATACDVPLSVVCMRWRCIHTVVSGMRAQPEGCARAHKSSQGSGAPFVPSSQGPEQMQERVTAHDCQTVGTAWHQMITDDN